MLKLIIRVSLVRIGGMKVVAVALLLLCLGLVQGKKKPSDNLVS